MIVSMNSVATFPRWLNVGVLALAIGLLPFGIAYSQDFDAVERRLGAAVSEGELNLSQAEAMMQALRATSENHELEKLKAGIEQRLRQFAEELRRQFAAEEITKEELEEKYKAAEREMWGHYRQAEMQRRRGEHEQGKGEDLDTSHEPYIQRIREIEEAMKAGKIPQEEGERALIETRRAMEGALDKGDNSQAELGRKMQEVVKVVEAYEAELMKEVESGRMSKDEFSKKLVAYSNTVMSRTLGSGNNRSRKADPRSERYSGIKKRLGPAVGKGELSKDEAEEKLIQARQEIFGR